VRNLLAFWRKEPKPGQPHDFRETGDAGRWAVAAGDTQWAKAAGSFSHVPTADDGPREQRCGVPGCGKERSDPIHHGG
jgi:hypothetical protein